jgi:hypothetical protein
MEKTLVIDGRQVQFRATGAFFLLYKMQFGKDGINDMFGMFGDLETATDQETEADAPESTKSLLAAIDLEVLYNMIWTLAKAADSTIPDPLTWLNEFSEFPMNDIVVELQELLQKSMVSTKKKPQRRRKPSTKKSR